MNKPADHFLARTALALDQDGIIIVKRSLNLFLNFAHASGAPEDKLGPRQLALNGMSTLCWHRRLWFQSLSSKIMTNSDQNRGFISGHFSRF